MRLKYFIYILLIPCLWGCQSNARVIHFINEEADFSEYETYRLIALETDNPKIPMEALVFYNQIEKGIIDEMRNKEFKVKKRPELLVRYEFVGSQRTEREANNIYNPYSTFTPTIYTSKIVKEGILIIEFRDWQKKKLIWQGSIDLNFEEESPTDQAYEAVKKIMATYPYMAGSDELPIDDKKKKKKDKKEKPSDVMEVSK